LALGIATTRPWAPDAFHGTSKELKSTLGACVCTSLYTITLYNFQSQIHGT
jgi:hypothetical protein